MYIWQTTQNCWLTMGYISDYSKLTNLHFTCIFKYINSLPTGTHRMLSSNAEHNSVVNGKFCCQS